MLQPQKNGCLLSSFLLFAGVYYFISIKILPRTEKSYPHREKTTPFPTRPVFLTPDRTDPRFKQNIAPWPESGRGCTVRSGNLRRSGMPRSSLLYIKCFDLHQIVSRILAIRKDKTLAFTFEADDIVCWLVNPPIAKLDLFKSANCRWISKSYAEYCYRNSATVRRPSINSNFAIDNFLWVSQRFTW